MNDFLNQFKLAKVVREQAREIAEIVGNARTLGGRYVNDVLQVVRGRARAWVRDAYLTGYSDGLSDVVVALGLDKDPRDLRVLKELSAKIQDAARARVAGERAAHEADQRRRADARAALEVVRRGARDDNQEG